jgi:aminocarboxymuconate-semialdehyde decarboxylase
MSYENRITQRPSEYLRRVFADTTNASIPNHLANLDVMGADRIMFGTDSPPLATPLQASIDMIRALPITPEEQEKILSKNAIELFKLNERAMSGPGGR